MGLLISMPTILAGIAGVLFAIGTAVMLFTTIPVAHYGVLTYFGKDIDAPPGSNGVLSPGYWYIIPGIFNIIIQDGKEDSKECSKIKAVTKQISENSGEITEGSVIVEAVDVDVQWRAIGRGFLSVEREHVDRGLEGYVKGGIRYLIENNSFSQVQGAGPDFEDKLLWVNGQVNGTRTTEIRDLETRWGIEIFRINIGNINMTKAFRKAYEKIAIEVREHQAEDVEMTHVGTIISNFANTISSRDGISKAEATRLATQVYQNQTGKTLGINFSGGEAGDFARGAGINAANTQR